MCIRDRARSPSRRWRSGFRRGTCAGGAAGGGGGTSPPGPGEGWRSTLAQGTSRKRTRIHSCAVIRGENGVKGRHGGADVNPAHPFCSEMRGYRANWPGGRRASAEGCHAQKAGRAVPRRGHPRGLEAVDREARPRNQRGVSVYRSDATDGACARGGGPVRPERRLSGAGAMGGVYVDMVHAELIVVVFVC